MRWMLAVIAVGMLSLPAGAVAGVRVKAGRVAPDGLAEVSGKMPKSHKVKPKAYALSKDKRFGAGDIVLGAGPEKAKKGTFKAWISMPGDLATGTFKLLACSKSKPARKTCWAVGSVAVKAAPDPVTATPVLDTGRMKHAVLNRKGGSVSATAADGTRFTVTIPAGTTDDIDVTLTPVTALNPASATGKLVDGVMIGPAGQAPPGATLQIDAAKTPARSAAIVAFGGVDPSGAAFPLPIIPVKHMRIALTNFGGYGIAGAMPSGAATAPLACPPARTTQSAGAQPVINCVDVAKRNRQTAAALEPNIAAAHDAAVAGKAVPGSVEQEIAKALTAADQAVDGEMDRVLKQTASDEGDAELEVLAEDMITIQRQQQLMGLPAVKVTNERYAQILDYHLKLVKSHCAQASIMSNDLVGWAWEAFYLGRSFYLIDDGSSKDLQAIDVWKQCMLRARYEVDATSDATMSQQDLSVHVTVAADHAPIYAKEVTTGLGLDVKSDPTNLTYSASDVTVNPPNPGNVETASIKATGGVLELRPSSFTSRRKIRCDKDRHLHVEFTVELWVLPSGADVAGAIVNTWGDTQTISIAFNGTPIGDRPWAGSAFGAWSNVYPFNSPAFSLPPDDKTVVPKTSNGTHPCVKNPSGDPNCHFEFSDTFKARQMPAGP